MGAGMKQFYAGMLDVGKEPDWELVARYVDLLQASGVHMECMQAVKGADGSNRLPFFARMGMRNVAMGGSADPKALIEDVCPYKLGEYRRIDTKTVGPIALRALVKIADENTEAARTKAADLKPRKDLNASGADAFAGLIGLGRQQEILRKVGAVVSKHGRGAIECMHMAFTGNPGTGKTELARRLSAHLDALGVTDGSGTFVAASAADLLAPYLGQTPMRTRRVVERALGGVLFIDEAYSLLAGGSYGQEAIDTLVEMLESERDRLVCVIAGYPDQIEELFGANPGLRDRFGLRVTFDDYTTPELVRIFCRFAHAHGFALEDGVSQEVSACMDALRGKRDFANARSVRRLYDRAAMECAMRCDQPRIAPIDVRRAYEQPDIGGATQGRKVGF